MSQNTTSHPFIVTYNGNQHFPRVSSTMRDHIANDWDLLTIFPDNNPIPRYKGPGKIKPVYEHFQRRAEFLYGLQEYYNAMMRIGGVEHTNDWDWAVWVKLTDGTYLGDQDSQPYDEEVSGPYCDTFSLVRTHHPDVAAFDFANFPLEQPYTQDWFADDVSFKLDMWSSNGMELDPIIIPVRQIATLTITER